MTDSSYLHDASTGLAIALAALWTAQHDHLSNDDLHELSTDVYVYPEDFEENPPISEGEVIRVHIQIDTEPDENYEDDEEEE